MYKLLIEIPTWLGDCVMTTPAIENIIAKNPDAQITIFGSAIATQIFKYHQNIHKIVVDKSRNKKFRLFYLTRLAQKLGQFDAAISFRRTFSSKLFIYFSKAKLKGNYQRYDNKIIHQVIRYNDFINQIFSLNSRAGKLIIHQKNHSINPQKNAEKIVGINPGASYGSAKRWQSQGFASVSSELANQYQIMIFGGAAEVDIAADIEQGLIARGVKNYQNLAGQSTVAELITHISKLDLFITGDSGPMHIAAAFQIPTVAIFGPTKDAETSQWQNENGVIVKKNLDCQPCMRRVCPLKHHDCMRLIKSLEVLEQVRKVKSFPII
jgi:heptosyltransferase-2